MDLEWIDHDKPSTNWCRISSPYLCFCWFSQVRCNQWTRHSLHRELPVFSSLGITTWMNSSTQLTFRYENTWVPAFIAYTYKWLYGFNMASSTILASLHFFTGKIYDWIHTQLFLFVFFLNTIWQLCLFCLLNVFCVFCMFQNVDLFF